MVPGWRPAQPISDLSWPTPTVEGGGLTMISMVPLVILVPMERAWKKDVFSGPSPVFCLGSVTLMGAMAPALAAAGTYREVQGGR